jgi:cytochrome c oxidase subunit 2
VKAAAATALTLGACAALPPSAFADLLAPDSPASPQSSATRTMYVIAVVVTLLVAFAAIAAVLRAARGRGGDEEASTRTRGTRGIQRRVGAGIGIAVIVLFVVGVIFTEQATEVDAAEAAGEPITIQVDGQQWLWRYEYPAPEETPDSYSAEAPFGYYDLVVPVDTPITLDVSSVDVRHRWWVPALARQVDAIPGEENSISFVADEVGDYEGRSTEFSGAGFATMRTEVHVVEQEEYEAYLGDRLDDINLAREAVQESVSAEDPGGADE